jgi:hypothetical protein
MLATTFAKIPKWVFAAATLVMCLLLAAIAALAFFMPFYGLSGAASSPFNGAREAAPQEQYGVGSGAAAASDGSFFGLSADSGATSGGEAQSAGLPQEAPAAGNTRGLTTDAIQQSQQQAVNRLIIRNGSVTVAVNDTQSARATIEGIVAQYTGDGAFVVSTNVSPSGSGQSPYIDMSIRIPAKHFDEVMKQLVGMAAEGTTPTSNESSEDVTSQYVDLDSRLKALEAARDRLQQIMAEAQTTEDLLNAEQQLTQREADIEALKGQMQYLSQSAALSSISISIQPYIVSQPVDSSWNPLETARRALEDLLGSFQNAGDFLIGFAIVGLPWLVVLGLIGYGGFRLVRWMFWRNRGKKAADNVQ